jgi:Methyltransferase domain
MNSRIILPKVPLLHGRFDFVLSTCQGKSVLHLGCVDAGLYDQRYQQQDLLHAKLNGVARELWGVDIDTEGLSYLQKHGFDHLIQADVCMIDQVKELQGKNFEVILATELIEHLLNPGLFLEAVKKLMVPKETRLIITVPNAFRIKTLLGMLDGIEIVHPDHNYWFSYLTVKNIVEKSGYQVKGISAYTFLPSRILPSSLEPGHLQIKPHTPGSPVGSKRPEASTFHRGWHFIRSLPLRLLASYLFHRTSFWGDGLILVCELP